HPVAAESRSTQGVAGNAARKSPAGSKIFQDDTTTRTRTPSGQRSHASEQGTRAQQRKGPDRIVAATAGGQRGGPGAGRHAIARTHETGAGHGRKSAMGSRTRSTRVHARAF